MITEIQENVREARTITTSAANTDRAAAAPESGRTDPQTIWLVEDEASFRETVSRVINRVPGFKCTGQFASAEHALDTLRRGEVPDVVLLDVQLPGQNGLEAVKEIRRISPATRVLMLTVFQDDEKIFKAICGGACGYLLKTAPSSAIVQSIREAIAGGAPMTPRIAKSVLKMFAKLGGNGKDNAEYGLTPREKEVVQLMADGLVTKQIAERLSLSYRTADTHLKNIYTKLHVHTRGEAINKVLKEGLV